MVLRSVPILLLSAFATVACAARTPAAEISAAALRSHIAVLAGDAFEGRRPGTAGGERTEAYLIEAFAGAGLLPGAPGGTWRQPVALTAKEADGRERRFESANIVGRIAGSDRADEAVVVTAHWDHLGLCRPAGAPDRICNGAVDNASGVAMLVEIGRRLAAGPVPHRSVYLVATTAEELGLVGARAFARQPPLPLDHIVAALNLDTAAVAGRGAPVGIIGRGLHPAIDAVVDAVSRQAGRRVDADTEANILVKRQDGWALGEAGVPAVMVGGSFSDMARLKAYLAGDYHQPGDDPAHLPSLDGAAEDATLHVALIRALADPARYPAPVRPS